MTQPPADDLVERLISIAGYSGITLAHSNRRALREAAAELTRLRAMCDELAGAVEPFTAMRLGKEPAPRPITDENIRRVRTAYAKYQEEQGR